MRPPSGWDDAKVRDMFVGQFTWKGCNADAEEENASTSRASFGAPFFSSFVSPAEHSRACVFPNLAPAPGLTEFQISLHAT